MLVKTYKFHPQPSSRDKCTRAAIAFDFHNQSVLDCFCGCGTHGLAAIQAGVISFRGTDIENYSEYLRKDIARFDSDYTTFDGSKAISFHWGIDAFESIKTYEHDILFIDPPNPYQIAGGTLLSTLRDTGLSGNEISKMWASRFNDSNWIKKKDATIENVVRLVETDLNAGNKVLANLFKIKSNKFDYANCFSRFELRQVYDSYYEVRL